ncbi:MAG: hypothetical protein U1D69_02710 [Polynucleobacter sp.]|nr:hypothetical protein [Polynucleobacter sp.]
MLSAHVANVTPIFASLLVSIILGGCGPSVTNNVILGECASFVLPTEAGRNPDGYFEFYSDGSLLSGKAKPTSADPDDFPQQYGIVGPTVGRLIVLRGQGVISIDLAVPAGKQIILTDERSNVRCTVIGPTVDVRFPTLS